VLGGHPGVLRGADGWWGVFGAVVFRVVVHTDRKGNVRIISARKATHPERKNYEETN
jgi:uncharacterized DUF497 family protein